ncbi:ABC transporter permease [Mucilaginibacter daejeonensis]|uniref:ABC transporter permease n=1 Tax=Mucilaginibacter daejeonensis TaxID=398049 RepID=UPI001D177D61|nr:ABC transporter permease [Mucilaginibacter daejeonensis]UEG55158.1 ABC transporter permease [Mucilaginibacter daejeonensis]
MLKNYIKIAWRNLWKGRIFNFMNVTGLSVAVACCTLIFLTVYYEFSYDSFHENIDNIYQVYNRSNRPTGVEVSTACPIPLAPAIKADYPFIKYTTRSGNSSAEVRYGGKTIEQDVHFVDPDFFKMFSFSFLKGNEAGALSGLNSVVLTQTSAKAIFGTEDVQNKTITLNMNGQEMPFVVSGVIKDIPDNSSITFHMAVRFEHFTSYKADMDNWNNRSHFLFLQFKDGYDPSKFSQQLKPFVNRYYAESINNLKKDGAKPDVNGNLFSLAVAPFSNNHFATQMGGVEGSEVSKIYPISLMVIGCFILVIACINFINLSVARGFTRAREVGVRKTLGAGKLQLLAQFWTETIMVCLTSTLIGLLLAALLMKPFKAIFRSHIELKMMVEPKQLLGILIIFMVVTAVAGFYPALMMIRYKTVAVLKGTITAGKPGKLRNTLLVVQFALSTLLIICTIITWQQITYLNNKPLGYNKTEVLSIPVTKGQVGTDALHVMRNVLRANNEVVAVSGAYMNMGRGNDGSSMSSILGFEYQGHEVRTNIQRIDYDYLKTLDIKLLEGREFDPERATDSSAVIINESMARQLGGNKLIGTQLPMLDGRPKAEIVGIMKDYNFRSLHEEIAPLSLTMDKDYTINYIFVKVRPGNLVHSYDEIKRTWKKEYPNAEFLASWLNENTERQYLNEKRLSGIFVSGAVLAIVISCIGLLAISIMIVIQRTKEIGIRKVLGANVAGIVLMLSQDFIKLVLLAAVMAFPVAWYLMDHWLQGFAYRIHIQWWVFVAATLLAMILAVITVSFQSIKAALANPVKSLRSE